MYKESDYKMTRLSRCNIVHVKMMKKCYKRGMPTMKEANIDCLLTILASKMNTMKDERAEFLQRSIW
jgi:hypothetical protein